MNTKSTNGRCIFLYDLHNPASRCSNLHKRKSVFCDIHEKKAREDKVAVLVVPEIFNLVPDDYPHPTIMISLKNKEKEDA